MSSFVALYRGDSVSAAKIVAVSADPEIVAEFASRLLQVPTDLEPEQDPVLKTIENGRRRALRIITREAQPGVPR